MYLGFGPQDLENVIGAGQSFDDLITQTSTDGHVRFNAGAPGADLTAERTSGTVLR